MRSVFPWTETAEVLAETERAHRLHLGLDGRTVFAYPRELPPEDIARREAGARLGSTARWRIRLPLVLPALVPPPPEVPDPFAPEIPDVLPDLDLTQARAQLQRPLGRQVVILVQAGAAALGLWEEEENRAHRCFRRYVVRGTGRAQPTHLKTRGKSRYGSRLRLQNALRQQDETVTTLEDWRAEFGPFQVLFRSCPVRLWGDLREDLGDLLETVGEVLKVPLDVHRPSFEELLRVRRYLEHGRVEEARLEQD